MRDLKHKFHHFHDYYSRTYPRYESYTSREREHDLYNMMQTVVENNNIQFEHKLYYSISGGLNPVFKTNVLCAVGDSISTELSTPIIQQITMILSSPEASVALSAPVVNLITNSREIHAQTINVVGDALSTGILDQSLESGVGNIISGDNLIPQMFVATEKVLAVPEISDSFKAPVSAVIPSQEVSAIVAETAAKGNKISAIYGGTNIKDDDGDGKPDDEDIEPPITLIWGGLGA